MVVCSSCGTNNQETYKYCLGCGGLLGSRPEASGRSSVAGAPAEGARVTGRPPWPPPRPASKAPPPVTPLPGAPRSSAPPQSRASSSEAVLAASHGRACAGCGKPLQKDFRFCGSCGRPVEEPAPAPVSPSSDGRALTGTLIVIRPDGSEGESFDVHDGAVVGRDAGPLFVNDAYLSPRHALFRVEEDQLWIEDLGSLNGVYVRLHVDVPHPLRQGSVFRIGQEILQFEPLPLPAAVGDAVEMMGSPNPGFLGRIALVTGRDSIGNAYCIPPDGLYLGRERGDIIFPDDGYVSGLHCRIHGEAGEVSVTDVGSSNGTFVRTPREHRLKHGMMLLLGQQLFRLELGEA